MVGRYKYNKKLSLWARIRGQKLSFPVADPRTGEILFDAGHIVTDEEAREMDAIGVNDVTIEVDGRTMRVFSNHMVDLDRFVDFDPVAECGIKERVRESVLKELLEPSTAARSSRKLSATTPTASSPSTFWSTISSPPSTT